MRQQQTFRGFVFLIMMLVLLAFAFKFTSTAGAGDRLTYQEFLQVLDTEKVEEAVISQNPQAPTGTVTLTLEGDRIARQNVSDVKEAEQLLRDRNIDYAVEGVPQENTMLTVVMPFLLSIVVVIVIITMMNRGAARKRSKCQNDEFRQKPRKAQP